MDALGFFEAVFEDDDAEGGLDRCALIDEFAGLGRRCTAAVAALGAQ
ncbi:hypothetical protein [Streptomyces lydicus]